MTEGRLIAVVGPSGVGKDSLMTEIVAAAPSIMQVRRTITRAPGLGGEDYDAMTLDAFSTAAAEGAFCLHWNAHGLRYGIPQQVRADLNRGADCIANLSRNVLLAASEVFPSLIVLHVTASPGILADRLTARGRETAQDIQRRLASADRALPDSLDIVEICNDGPLEVAVSQALTALQPARV